MFLTHRRVKEQRLVPPDEWRDDVTIRDAKQHCMSLLCRTGVMDSSTDHEDVRDGWLGLVRYWMVNSVSQLLRSCQGENTSQSSNRILTHSLPTSLYR